RTEGGGWSGLRAAGAAEGACLAHDVTGLKAGQRFDNIESNLPHAVVRLDQQPERPVVGRSGEYHPSVIAITLFMVNTHRGFSRPKPFCRPIRHIVQDRFGQSYEVCGSAVIYGIGFVAEYVRIGPEGVAVLEVGTVKDPVVRPQDG